MYEKIERYTVEAIPEKGYEVKGLWKDDVHHLHARLVFDYQTYRITEAEAYGEGTPFSICPEGIKSIENLVGEQVGPGFNQVVKEKVMGKTGCVHVGEMVMNSIKAVIQAASRTVPEWIDKEDYASKWAAWEGIYKNKCIYFSQPEAANQAYDQIQKTISKNK